MKVVGGKQNTVTYIAFIISFYNMHDFIFSINSQQCKFAIRQEYIVAVNFSVYIN